MIQTFKLDVNPVPQGRVRGTTVRSKRSLSLQLLFYDPPASRSFKKLVSILIQQYKPVLFKGAIKLSIAFIVKRPVSHYRTGKYSHLLKENAPVTHTIKPDLDNLIKAIKDSMKDICFHDDAQICEYGEIYKTYGFKGQIQIILEEIDNV